MNLIIWRQHIEFMKSNGGIRYSVPIAVLFAPFILVVVFEAILACILRTSLPTNLYFWRCRLGIPSNTIFFYFIWILKSSTVNTFNRRQTKSKWYTPKSYSILRIRAWTYETESRIWISANLYDRSSISRDISLIHGMNRLGWVGSRDNLIENDPVHDKMDAIKILFSEKACGFDCDEILIGRFAAPCVSQNHDRHHRIIIISNLTESFILPGTE